MCVLRCPIQPVRSRVSIHCDWLLYHRCFALCSEADKLVPRVVSYVIVFFPSLFYSVLFTRNLPLTCHACSSYLFIFTYQLQVLLYIRPEKNIHCVILLCFSALISQKHEQITPDFSYNARLSMPDRSTETTRNKDGKLIRYRRDIVRVSSSSMF